LKFKANHILFSLVRKGILIKDGSVINSEFQPFSISSGPETQAFFMYFSKRPAPELLLGVGRAQSGEP